MSDFILSNSAVKKICNINYKTSNPLMLRIRIEGGGCNGMKYDITLTNRKTNNDIVFRKDGAQVVIDKVSMQFLEGSKLEYIDSLGSSSFVIKNMKSKSSCGCGSSFSF